MPSAGTDRVVVLPVLCMKSPESVTADMLTPFCEAAGSTTVASVSLTDVVVRDT